MAAPSGIVWGSIVGSYGRIGIYVNKKTDSSTTVQAEIQVWFWSKYTVSDSSNVLYVDDGTSSASTSKGAVTVKTTVASGGGWSTTNQVKLYTLTGSSVSKGQSSSTRYCSAKLTNIDRVGGTMTVKASYTIGAKPSYKVTYNANGGSGVPSTQTKWYGTTLTLSSTKPTRTGYTFAGWATSSSGSVVYNAGGSYTANAAVTLYAKWTAVTYTVTYDANSGSGAPSDQTKTYGVNLTLSSTKPTRTGYTFQGWATSSTGSVAYQPGGTYTANAAVTLYAIWKQAYTNPTISVTFLYRCDSSGTSDSEGAYAKVTVKYSLCTTAGTNTLKSITYKNNSNSSSASITVSSSTTSPITHVIGGGLSTETNTTYTYTITDSKGGTATTTVTIPSAKYLIDFYKGSGVSIGKTATTANLFDVGLPTTFNNEVKAWCGSGRAQFRAVTSAYGFMIRNDSLDTYFLLTDSGKPNGGWNSLRPFRINNSTGKITIETEFIITGAATFKSSLYSNNYATVQSSYSNGSSGSAYRAQLNIVNDTNSTDTFLTATRTNTSQQVRFGVGAGGTNRGIYDASADAWMIYMNSSNALILGTSKGNTNIYSANGYYFYTSATSSNPYAFRMTTSNALSLGGSGYLWRSVYAATTTISTSDRNKKKDFTEFDDRFEKLFDELKPQRFKFIENTSNRYHSGFIAQDVEDSLENVGLTALDFAGFCKDARLKPELNKDFAESEDDYLLDDEGNKTYDYSLRYSEFIALNTWQIQKLKAKVSEQQTEIENLKERVSMLEELVLSLIKE